MTANAAFAAALTTFLIVAWLAGELAFLAPFKGLLFHRHGWAIGGAILLLFLNLCALYYGIALLIGLVTGVLWIAWKLFEVHVLR